MRSSLTSGELKATSLSRFMMSRAVFGTASRTIGLICTRIVSSTSGVISALRKTRPVPVRTLVAVMNRRVGTLARQSKSTVSARMPRSGWVFIGFRS